MFKKLLAIVAIAGISYAHAQDSTSAPLAISGSVDAYYKYDFAKTPNIATSFATDQNSVSIGMIDIALKKVTGKAFFVGEVSFGPRGQFQSIPNSDQSYTEGNGNSFHIQNLYASLALTDKFSLTGGYMGTFVGYEVISPVGNYNYSTSYLFANGPFQNAGLKGTYAFSSKASLMVGLFNDWNVYTDVNGVSHVGAQLALTPLESWSAYLNVLSGYSSGVAYGSGTVLDFTTSYQLTDAFKLGLNVADYSITDDAGGYTGAALYLQNSFTNSFGLGLRAEYFSNKSKTGFALSNVTSGESVAAITLSGNVKAGGLTIIPEVRFDNGSMNMFVDNDLSPSKTASQFSIAAVYAF